MIRVVLDTNVIVSAVLKPAGAEAAVVELVGRRLLQIVVTSEILNEYRGVLSRPTLHLDPARVASMLDLIAQEAITVSPGKRLAVSHDESDNRFLECAEDGSADYLVTGNKRHFPASWKTTRIVNARELLRILETPAQ